MAEHTSKKSTGSSDALKNIVLESIKSNGLDFEEISKDKMHDDEWSFVVYGIVYSLFIRALKSQPTTLQLEFRIELGSEEYKRHWDKGGVIQFKNERIAILQRKFGQQVQFIVAYDDLVKEGYRLMAIDEGKEASGGGRAGGANAYFYFQKVKSDS